MFRVFINSESILIGCERTLYIEHNEREIIRIVDNAIAKIESEFGLVIGKSTIQQLLLEPTVSNASLELFIQQIAEVLKSLSFLITLTCHDRQFPFHLRDYSFLGFEESNCLAALKVLQDVEMFTKRESFYNSFIRSVDRLNMCELKRWLCILAVFERLGIAEGVSCISQFLYICSTWRA